MVYHCHVIVRRHLFPLHPYLTPLSPYYIPAFSLFLIHKAPKPVSTLGLCTSLSNDKNALCSDLHGAGYQRAIQSDENFTFLERPSMSISYVLLFLSDTCLPTFYCLWSVFPLLNINSMRSGIMSIWSLVYPHILQKMPGT